MAGALGAPLTCGAVTPPTETPTIWIDLTDLEHWAGTLTGIQRTEVEYLVRLKRRYGARVRGFVFRYRPDRIVPAALEIRGAKISVDVEGEARPESIPASEARPSFRARARRKVRASALQVPGARRIGRKLRSLRHASEVVMHGPASTRAPFAAGDHVVVLGGNWPTPGYADFLASVRDEVPLRLTHVVYDLFPITCPQWAPAGGAGVMEPYMRRLLPAADVVVTISEATADDVVRYLTENGLQLRNGIRPITVLLGADPVDGAEQLRPPTDVDPATPFILCVGTTEIRKNHGVLYQVYALAAERGISVPPLYLVGSEGWLSEATIHLLSLDPAVAPNVRLLRGVADAELHWLYRNARVVLYPSFAEGWGLPIGEAASYGKVCVTTPHSSMPEVAGEFADYASPYDPAAILDRIVHYLDDESLAAREA